LWAAIGAPIEQLHIVATNPEQCLRVTLHAADRLKFWRRTPDWSTLTGIRA
jgi:hypothetical protein